MKTSKSDLRSRSSAGIAIAGLSEWRAPKAQNRKGFLATGRNLGPLSTRQVQDLTLFSSSYPAVLNDLCAITFTAYYA